MIAILSGLMMGLQVLNGLFGLVEKSEKAFSGKKGSGAAKKKLAMEGVRILVNKSALSAAEKKAMLAQSSATIDQIVKTTKLVNVIKRK